jgi:hypothetical protein
MSAPHRLSGEDLASFTSRLSGSVPLYAALIAESPVEVVEIAVPSVLAETRAFHVVIGARRRPVELFVAQVGEEQFLLGDSDQLDALCAHIGLQLEAPEQVGDFLRLWSRVAVHHTRRLVETAADFQWIPGVTTDPDLRARADRAAHLARRIAVGHPASGAFPAEVTMLDQRTLELRHLRVTSGGHVDEVGHVVLMHDVPVPYTMP